MQNPTDVMSDLTKQMGWLNQMFGEDFFTHMQNAGGVRPRSRQAGAPARPVATGGAPPLEIYVTPNEVVICATLPGLSSQEDVAISLTSPHELVLEAMIQPPPAAEPTMVLLRERFTGYCHRLLTLPAPVLATGARTRYVDGLLEIHLPRADAGSGTGGVALLHVSQP